ncbi:MAG: diguanylate cyclase domain-containing protein [Phycisphaerae bacterium]
MFTPYDGVSRDDAPLILVVDDQADTMRLIARMLQSDGYRTLSSEGGANSIDLAEKFSPQAILLDILMPEMDGYTMCAELKSRLTTSDIPVLFVTGVEPSDDVISRCYDAGAHDLIQKPLSKVNLLSRLRVVLRDQALRDDYRRIATIDPQTGVNNRRQLFLYIADAIFAAKRDRSESILILGDIDQLGSVNDQYGYDFGDEVMLTLARLLKRFVSADCKVGRVAGGTLAVILKSSSKKSALSFCRRIGRTFVAIAFDAKVAPKHFTAKFGLAAYSGEPAQFDADEFMRRADAALFGAAERGRGGIHCYWDFDPDAIPVVRSEQRHARYKTRKKTNHAYVGLSHTPMPPTPPADMKTGDPSAQ